MKKQDYNNYRKFYAPHHFVFYPVLLVLMIVSWQNASKYPDQQMLWYFITGIFVLIGWLSFMLRQHYALGNQNRIVRLEMRLRYYQLTHQNFEPLEQQLSFGQIAALRFASDEELPVLVKSALANNLSSNDIKKSIKNWNADLMRV